MTVDPRYPTDYDGELEITHIRKHNWKTHESRDRWKEPLNACKDVWHKTELLAVASDETPRTVAWTDRGFLRDEDIVELLVEHGLHVRTDHMHAFVSDTTDAADAAVQAFHDDDHATMGELLGYPSCCIDAYLSDIDPSNDHKRPIYEMACRSECSREYPDDQSILLEDPDPLLNMIWAYLGWKFISHTPCSFDCEASIELARETGSFYRELGVGEEAERLWEFLGTPTTWSGYHGLSNIRNGYLIGSTNTLEYWDEKIVVWAEDHAAKLL